MFHLPKKNTIKNVGGFREEKKRNLKVGIWGGGAKEATGWVGVERLHTKHHYLYGKQQKSETWKKKRVITKKT